MCFVFPKPGKHGCGSSRVGDRQYGVWYGRRFIHGSHERRRDGHQGWISHHPAIKAQ